MNQAKKKKILSIAKKVAFWGVLAFFVFSGLFILWATTINLPNLDSFEERRVSQSTKIYDRTGEIILYDIFSEVKRTVIPLEDISDYAQKATIAAEDQDFYEHNGIQISAIIRAIRNNFQSGNILGGQGGSTITQQVIKNALLTRDKKISRKLKEWVLAPRLEKVLTKDEILEIYLNEVPYGGSVYGIQEAARRFFSKDAKDLTLAESAYLAALPQAPTYYSPYGNNLDSLEARKNYVLDQMLDSNFITKEEKEAAQNETVEFQKQDKFGIKAPHFVIYIREQLEKEYGKELIEEGGLKVITTLDWELQEEAERIVKEFALENEINNEAENAALVAMDPKLGEILVMVGSRDYFDENIDGNFNIATAERQPGSTFKPIVYAAAFEKGYRPETVVFDLPTEFSAVCATGGSCYNPVNYDNKFRGPMSLRDALAQSINIPAIKTFYLAGQRNALTLAKNMGLETLTDLDRYGLTLVLGGGEVTPLDLTTAYSVFASEGVKKERHGFLKIETSDGETLFEKEKEEENKGERIMSEQSARLISSVLSDNVARTPAYSATSPLYFPGRDVAVKTGTTNDYRDAWIIGYTPNIVVGSWAGNNDNRSMVRKTSSYIISPMWNEFMQFALEKREQEFFTKPEPIDPNIKPVLAGYWKGEQTAVIDSKTGELASKDTDDENRSVEVVGKSDGIHSILYWVDTDNPLGPKPDNPNADPQYRLWEDAVRKWVNQQGISDDVDVKDFTQNSGAKLTILSPENGKDYYADGRMVVSVSLSDGKQIVSSEVFLNSKKIGELDAVGNSILFIPREIDSIASYNRLEVRVTDQNGKTYSEEINFGII